MMRVTTTFDGPALTFNATVRGLPIYLDHDSLTDMANGDPRRRERFIAVLRGGGDLLFSVTTAVELGDRQGKSVETIRVYPHRMNRQMSAIVDAIFGERAKVV
jgi:hypothetical protein